ncbi:MAG: hypothetical protein ACYSSI_08715 [Planctomycetota bacterium]
MSYIKKHLINYNIHILVICLITFVISGCKDKNSNDAFVIPKGQDTPEAALRKFYHSLVNDDKKSFLECFTPSKECQILGEDMFRQVQLTREYRNKLIKSFGENAWEDYQKAWSGELQADLSLPPENDLDIWLGKFTKRVEGNKVLFVNSLGEDERICFVKTSNIWFVNNYNVKNEMKLVRSVNNAIKFTMSYMGKPDVNMVDLKVIMAKKIFK